MNYKEIRCPGHNKTHSTYDACGAFLGGLESGSALFKCPRCGLKVVATMEHNHIRFDKPVTEKNGKIKMERIWRIMHDETR